MPLSEPPWWYGRPDDARARLLAPAAAVYGWVAERRVTRAMPYRAPLPVICVGNFTAGGTGKTPLSLALADLLEARGRQVAFLTRGYGGALAGPLLVDPASHTARQVGDEPLLLARRARTIVARDRAAGARLAAALGADVVVMDDGLQNPALAKTLAIAVVDGARGLGNGRVIPAGPLRAPLAVQLHLADAIVVNGPAADHGPGGGDAPAPMLATLRDIFPGPVLAAETRPRGDLAWLAGARVVAFAGIGNPQRFFDTARGLGAELVAARAFPDHHVPTPAEAEALLSLAATSQALLVTTEKDLARLGGSDGAVGRLAAAARAFEVGVVLGDRDRVRLASLIDQALAGFASAKTAAADRTAGDRNEGD